MQPVAVSAIYFPFRRHLTALRLLLTRRHRRRDRIDAFEKHFARVEDVPFAVATSMARTGLYQVLRSLDVKAGDPILMTPVNIPEMRAVIELLGLRPVFVDFAPHSLVADPEDLRRKIASSGARIFFLTHLAGHIADMNQIRALCHASSVTVIQDSTQSPLCRFRGISLARWADFSLYSTCELKFIHTYRGALIAVNEESRLAPLRAEVERTSDFQKKRHAVAKAFADFAASLILHPRLFARIFHRFQNRIFRQDPLKSSSSGVRVGPFTFFGDDVSKMRSGLPRRMHFRASDFEAALGEEALREVVPLVGHHRDLSENYRETLAPWGVLPRSDAAAETSAWRFPILLPTAEKADLFLRNLRAEGITVERTGLSLLSSDAPVARDVLGRMVFLPCHRGVSAPVAREISETAQRTLRELGLFPS